MDNWTRYLLALLCLICMNVYSQQDTIPILPNTFVQGGAQNTDDVSSPEAILISADTSDYVCSFDFIVSDGANFQILPARDIEFVKLISNVEKDVRFANYIKVYSTGRIRTAGATWRNNEQLFLYNPLAIDKIRSKYTNKDTLNILLKGLILHEIGHHTIPHSVLKLARKKKLRADSVKLFERQADNYMGQRLRRDYGVKAYEARSVIDKLVEEHDVVDQYFTKAQRIQNVMDGWNMGGSPLALVSPMYKAYLRLFEERTTRILEEKLYSGNIIDINALSSPFERAANFPPPSATIGNPFDLFVRFRIKEEEGIEYLFIRNSDTGAYEKIGVVVDHNTSEYPLIVYDQYFVTWYISARMEVFSLDEDGFKPLGMVQNTFDIEPLTSDH